MKSVQVAVDDEHCDRTQAELHRMLLSQQFDFVARYELNGDTLRYWRDQDGHSQLAWERKLSRFRRRGVALQGEYATAVFRRPRSFYPAIVILQQDRESVATLLERVGLKVERLEQTETV